MPSLDSNGPYLPICLSQIDAMFLTPQNDLNPGPRSLCDLEAASGRIELFDRRFGTKSVRLGTRMHERLN